MDPTKPLTMPKSTTYESLRGPNLRGRRPLNHGPPNNSASASAPVKRGAAAKERGIAWTYYVSIPVTVALLLTTILYFCWPAPSAASILDTAMINSIGISGHEYTELYNDLSACSFVRDGFLPPTVNGLIGHQQVLAVRQASIGLSAANLNKFKKATHRSNRNDTIQASQVIVAMLNQTVLSIHKLNESIDILERDIQDSQARYMKNIDQANKVFGRAIIRGSGQPDLENAEVLRTTSEPCRGAYGKAAGRISRWRESTSTFSNKVKGIIHYFETKMEDLRQDQTGKAASAWGQTFAEDIWKLIDDETISRGTVEKLVQELQARM